MYIYMMKSKFLAKKKKDRIDQLLAEVYQSSRYAGKQVIIVGGKVHATKTGVAASQMLERLLKKYPDEVPNITYIPKEDTLILIS